MFQFEIVCFDEVVRAGQRRGTKTIRTWHISGSFRIVLLLIVSLVELKCCLVNLLGNLVTRVIMFRNIYITCAFDKAASDVYIDLAA